MLRIYAPASSANISVGFDTLGAAISPIDGSLLGDVVQIESIPSGFELESAGYFVRKLPKRAAKKHRVSGIMCCLVSNLKITQCESQTIAFDP